MAELKPVLPPEGTSFVFVSLRSRIGFLLEQQDPSIVIMTPLVTRAAHSTKSLVVRNGRCATLSQILRFHHPQR